MPYPRNPKNWCVCGKHIKNSRSGKCKDCYWSPLAGGEKLLGDIVSVASRHRHQVVRNHAKTLVKRLGWIRKCAECDYDKHVELCHVKPIYCFPKEAKVSEINAPDNLKFLCPNHHWELDNL